MFDLWKKSWESEIFKPRGSKIISGRLICNASPFSLWKEWLASSREIKKMTRGLEDQSRAVSSLDPAITISMGLGSKGLRTDGMGASDIVAQLSRSKRAKIGMRNGKNG